MAKGLFDRVRDLQPGPFVIIILLVSIAAMIAGIVLLREDIQTSRMGYMALEQEYGFAERVYPETYFAMSIVPTIVTIMASYMFLTDFKKYKLAAIIWIIFFLMDVASDVYHVTNGRLDLGERTGVAMLITVLFFSIGSEFLISVGGGQFLASLPKSIYEARKIVESISESLSKNTSRRGSPSSGSGFQAPDLGSPLRDR